MKNPYTSSMKICNTLYCALLIILGCHNKQDQPQPHKINKTPGFFSLLPTDQYQTITAASIKRTLQNTSELSLYYGDLKGSKAFNFILSNAGDEDIFDIQLTSSIPEFEIFPKKISRMTGRKSEESGSAVMPVVSVEVNHGALLNGAGVGPVLEPRSYIPTLNILGKTIDKKDTIEVSLNFQIIVDAKLMDFDIIFQDETYDWNNRFSSIIASFKFPSVVGHGIKKGSYLKNTGNVPLQLKIYQPLNNVYSITKEVILKMEEEQVLQDAIYEISADGTVADPDKFFQEADGAIYYSIELY